MRYIQLADQCVQQIESGQLALHTKMPSLRKFKQQHGVSMTTALNCYQHLESLGWLIAKPQSGYYVAQQSILGASIELPTLVAFKSMVTQPKQAAPQRILVKKGPLGLARYDPELIPTEKLQKSFKRAMKRQGAQLSDYPDPQGLPSLRQSLNTHFKHIDFHFSAQDCVITHGCLDAVRTCIEVTTKEGDAVAISSPCFSGLLELLAGMGRNVVEIPSVDQGIDLVQLENQMQQGNITAGLFCTSHMNPQGLSMSALQKQKLVELATHYKIPIIEDDVYLELGYQGVVPLPAKHWDHEGYILWCGSISKTIAAGYRLGWCLPGRYLKAYLHQRLLANQTVSSPVQLAITDFVERGDYARHLKNIRLHAQQQSVQYIHYLRENLPKNSKISQPAGGYVLWIEIPQFDANKLLTLAIENNIEIYIGESFSTLDLYPSCFRLNIGYTLIEEVKLQLNRLMALVEDCLLDK